MSTEWNTQRAFGKIVRSHLHRGAIAVALFDDARARGVDAYDDVSEELAMRLAQELVDGSKDFEEICAPRAEEGPREGACALCGRKSPFLTKDHLWPKSKGGKGGDNFVMVCPGCNSDKKNMDLFEWLDSDLGRSWPVPIAVVRRYLLNAWRYCEQRNLLDKQVKNVGKLPFKLRNIPARLRLDRG